MSRTLIVANRLPVTAKVGPDGLVLRPSAGGLATGLRDVHDPAKGLWFGWSGLYDEPLPADAGATGSVWSSQGFVPIPLSRTEVRGYYQSYCNGVVWPLLHSLLGHLPLRPGPWPVYDRINRRFAEAVAGHYRAGDLVWVHDYHLMRVPAMVRERVPGARIGFFLHVPFPSVEIFSALPHRDAVLDGLLGADLVGFHTEAYRRNFAAAVERLLGVTAGDDTVTYRGRTVRLGVFPMGIDFERFAERSEEAYVRRLSAEYAGPEGAQLLLGVDRLDYTKGIPRRLLAFERLLHLHPELRGQVRLVQVAVPSRTEVPAYRRSRQQIDRLVGRINGTYGTASWTPVHYLVRSLSEDEVVALYRATDVMVVTPVRDGMNLVAKEFAASRRDEDGVLVLSEFAGAAAELTEALLVNPYDLDGTAATLYRALTMDPGERSARMRALRRRVAASDIRGWARAFLNEVCGTEARPPAARPAEPRGPASRGAEQRRPERRPAEPAESATPTPLAMVQEFLLRRVRHATRLVLLLDYDGTLVPFAPRPELAPPDSGLLTLLETLADRAETEVHLLSGRDRETLDSWFGSLRVGLHAEHGLWWRMAHDREWTSAGAHTLPRRADIIALLEQFATRVPGAIIEQKSVGLAWHYRMADPRVAAPETRRLRAALVKLLSGEPVDLLPGDHVLEVRPRGVDKGTAAHRLVAQLPPDALVVALGDDRTDEQLFAALPSDALTIHVGRSVSRARLRVDSVEEARSLLWALAADAASHVAGVPAELPPAGEA